MPEETFEMHCLANLKTHPLSTNFIDSAVLIELLAETTHERAQ